MQQAELPKGSPILGRQYRRTLVPGALNLALLTAEGERAILRHDAPDGVTVRRNPSTVARYQTQFALTDAINVGLTPFHTPWRRCYVKTCSKPGSRADPDPLA
jgi:hypothetical protein